MGGEEKGEGGSGPAQEGGGKKNFFWGFLFIKPFFLFLIFLLKNFPKIFLILFLKKNFNFFLKFRKNPFLMGPQPF